jgi:hypothetical protein
MWSVKGECGCQTVERQIDMPSSTTSAHLSPRSWATGNVRGGVMHASSGSHVSLLQSGADKCFAGVRPEENDRKSSGHIRVKSL